MAYRVVEDYYRQQHFDFFSRYESPLYSITFDHDNPQRREGERP